MQPSILLHRAPSTVVVGGVAVDIHTTHRTGIRAMQAADDPDLDSKTRPSAILMLYFGQLSAEDGDRRIVLPEAVLQNPDEAIKAALGFLNLNEPQKPQSKRGTSATKVRTWDWDHDAPRVISDFQREYGIDLTDLTIEMHWWRFWPLFRGLSDASLTMNTMAVRGADPSSLKGEEKIRLLSRQRELALPARTEEEALKLTSLLWGLDV